MFKDLDPALKEELISVFRMELGQQIDAIADCLMKLERELPDPDRKKLLEDIFRAAHNVKGASRGIGLEQVADLAHRLESLFTVLKRASLAPSGEMADLILETLDFMKETFEGFVLGQEASAGKVQALGDRIHGLTQSIQPGGKPLPATTRSTPALPPELMATPAPVSGSKPKGVGAPQADGLAPSQDSAPDRKVQKTLSPSPPRSLPDPPETQPETKTDSPPMGIRRQKPPMAMERPTREEAPLPKPSQPSQSQEPTVTVKPPKPQPPKPETIPATEEKSPPPASTQADTTKERRKSSQGEVLQVPVERMERLGAWAEELHVSLVDMELHGRATRSILDLSENLGRAIESGGTPSVKTLDILGELRRASAHLQQDLLATTRQLQVLTHSMQHDIRQLRLVRVATLTRPLVRSVRDLARELKKKVAFTISGDDNEIDRSILGRIRSPLTHLLNNALDHGLEPPDQRLAAGKPEEGRLTIDITREGSRILIRIQDDGRGLDPEWIARQAVKKGLLTREEVERLDRQKILELVFRPGFSSREIVTAISGRGVGLDVVRSNMHAINGRATLLSKKGQGTTITLELPLTLATERGLLVHTGGQLFAIPTLSVERIIELTPERIVRVENNDAILLDDHPVPLAALSDILRLKKSTQPPTNPDKTIKVVVVAQEWHMAALIVDEVEGEREIVVKKLQPPLHRVENVSGGAVTGTGQVVIVLDPRDLVESAPRLKNDMSWTPKESETAEKPIPHILVVDDSITTRTLEKSILQNAGYQVSVATDGEEAWEILKTRSFDLVVTDVEMPITNGIVLTGRIKQSDTHQETPVIIVSSLGRDEDKERGIEVGADAYIVKNQFETRALLEVVEQLLLY
ncbi:MAG: hybrid sensor histidine kinase/response regulator [Magnetococcales bacterium]|nr:hybrid sensor histidine kinase/response regulator [Magnetococcales bacterium]